MINDHHIVTNSCYHQHSHDYYYQKYRALIIFWDMALQGMEYSWSWFWWFHRAISCLQISFPSMLSSQTCKDDKSCIEQRPAHHSKSPTNRRQVNSSAQSTATVFKDSTCLFIRHILFKHVKYKSRRVQNPQHHSIACFDENWRIPTSWIRIISLYILIYNCTISYYIHLFYHTVLVTTNSTSILTMSIASPFTLW